jgi:WD40 repeat protein
MLFSRIAALSLCLITGLTCHPALAEDDSARARDDAGAYYEADEARKAVATLAEAAARDPKNRLIGAMLYSGIRDHVWHLSETLPVKLDGAVKALAFSRDGTKLASASEKGEVVISSTAPLEQEKANAQYVKVAGEGDVIGLAFARDGKRLAVARKSGPVEVWDLEGNRLVFTSAAPDGTVTAFVASKETGLVAIGTENGAGQVFDIAAGKMISSFRQSGGAIKALALSHNGKKLVAAGAELSAQVWEVATGKKIGAGVAHKGAIRSVDFSYDDRYVVSAGDDKIAWLSDPESGVAVMPPMNCGSGVKKAAISPDGSMIATLLDERRVLFWDAFTGERLQISLNEDAPMNDFLWTLSGLRAATISEDGHASLWTVRSASRRGETMPHDAPVRVAALNDDSKLLATGCTDGVVRIWRTDGGATLPTVRSHNARARTAFYSRSAEDLITTSEDHTALHWKSGQVNPFGPALKHRGKVTCGVFSPDGKRIITGDDTGVAQIWESDTGRAQGAPFLSKGPVNWVDFHVDGERCVVASGPTATVWSVTDHSKLLATVTHPDNEKAKEKSEIKKARFSRDGKWLGTASTDGTARIWDGATYQPVTVIQRDFPVLSVRFSPDSSRLVVAGEDGQAAVYDVATWKQVGTPVLAPGPIFSAAITEDNLFLVISSLLLDAVQFFEIETGRPIGTGVPVPSQATSVDYNVPDKVVVIACDDGTVRAVETPFVAQDVPPWMIEFTQRLIGLRKTGPDTFERVYSHSNQLRAYDTAPESTEDFLRLVHWKMSPGTQRHGMPRFSSTIAANIQRRVEERSVDALFECHEAVSGDPLILAALSLYLPNRRQGEYLADLVLSTKDAPPLARTYAAGTLIQAGRSEEAEKVLAQALKETPDDPLVLRRIAKREAGLSNKSLAIELFEKALRLDPNNARTHRDYAWVLYNFQQPTEAAKHFLAAQEQAGEMIDDLVAGLCLCAAAEQKDAEARAAYAKLAQIDPQWKKPTYIAGLQGWTQRELSALERVRAAVFPAN